MVLAAEGCFCFGCGAKQRIISVADNTLTKREVIAYYFHCGYGYKAVVYLLKTYYDI